MLIKHQISLLMGLCFVFAGAEPLMRNGAAANSARIAYVSTRGGNPDIHVMDSDGKHRSTVTTHDAEDTQPTWSPDGAKIAFVSNRNGGNIQIWVIDADGRNPIRLTDGTWDNHPDWSPDGSQIAYQASRKKALNIEKWNYEIYVMHADGSNKKPLTNHPAYDGHPCWSPDGRKIAFASNREEILMEIYVMDANGRNVRRITHNFHDQEEKFMPTWSPDGRRIAYVWNLQIYVMDSNGDNQRRLTEKGEGRYPTWSPDGGTIAYESWEGFNSPHGIYTAGVRSGAVTLISEIHRKGDFQPDWFNPWELSVSPAGNRITMWGRLKNGALRIW